MIVGRDGQRRRLVGARDAAVAGDGRSVLVVGEHGVGKSRLVHELTDSSAQRGIPVLVGRAVDRAAPEPFRPLAEALLAGLRDGPADISGLEPFLPALARLAPQLRPVVDAPPDGSLLVLAEGVLRLLRLLAGGTGLVLVQEDLQWADADTLAVLEYLVDHLAGAPVLLLSTACVLPGDALSKGVRRRVAGRSAEVVELRRLEPESIAAMAMACLGSDELPDTVLRWLVDRADGLPCLVEELLTSAEDAGVLRGDSSGWSFSAPDVPVVPAAFADSVRTRLAALEDTHLEVLHAAAVCGRRFDARLLPELTGRPEATVLTALRAAGELRLVVAADHGVTTHWFRNLLTHEAVLGQLPGYRIAELAARALATVQAAHPELNGEWCDIAAAMADAAGDQDRVGALLLESGTRALALGALAHAESALLRARDRVGDDSVLAAVEYELLRVLVLGGQPERARAVGGHLVDMLDRIAAPATQRGQAHLELTRAGVLSGDWELARRHLAEAIAAATAHPVLGAMVDSLAAQLAVAEGRAEEAAWLARRATHFARQVGLDIVGMVEVFCDSQIVLGRTELSRDSEAARTVFGAVLRAADRYGLSHCRLRALQLLGAVDEVETFRLTGLREAMDSARAAGAFAVAAYAGLDLAMVLFLRRELDEALEVARGAAAAGRRYSLAGVTPTALLTQAMVHGTALRGDEMERAIHDALACPDVAEDVRAGVWGQARAEYSLCRADRAAALRELDTAMSHLRRSGAGGWSIRGMRALLSTVDGNDGSAAREEVRNSDWGRARLNRAYLHYAEAVDRGRAGCPELADASFAAAEGEMSMLEGSGWLRHRARWLVAGAAVADGWGQPVAWLRLCLDVFGASGHRAMVAGCRSMLARAGAPVPRRSGVVPEELARFGLTQREVEVLVLVGQRLTNREIAARLYISRRTAEKHLERLLRKTATTSRTELISLALSVGSTGR
ncbi:MAG: ATP-binding protein [Sciscionella sp.]